MPALGVCRAIRAQHQGNKALRCVLSARVSTWRALVLQPALMLFARSMKHIWVPGAAADALRCCSRSLG